jgi:hypothetical protein
LSTADTDVRALLERELQLLHASPFDSLMERFTEIKRGRFTRHIRREERGTVVRELVADSGCTYDAEEWAVIEEEDQLYIFLEVMGYDASDQWAEASDDIVIRRNGQPPIRD